MSLRDDQVNKLQNIYWVIDAGTENPVSGASVKIYKDGAVAEMATTDKDGMAFLTPIADPEMTVVSLGSDNAVMSGYATSVNYAEAASNIKKMFLYSDKPLYRPGEEVNIKGLYKVGYDGFYEAPPSDPIALKITDSSQTVVKQVLLVPNGFGSISTVLTLDPSAKLGTYEACVGYQCTNFDVLDYAPAAFKIDMTNSKDEYVKGDDVSVDLKARYYFGVPLADATVKYHESSQYYYFNKYTKEYFNFNNLVDSDLTQDYYYGDHYIGAGDAMLDKKGETVIKPVADLFQGADSNQSKIVIIDATVKNQEGRSVSSQKSFIMHAAGAYIGSKIAEPFVGENDDISLKLKTVDTDANPKPLSVRANLYHVYWTSTKNGNGSMIWDEKRDLVKTFDATTDANGDGGITLPKQSEGEYVVDVVSLQTGAAVGSRSWFYVYGNQDVSVRGSDDTSLDLVMNGTKLKSGSTAEVLIKMPEGKGKALVTIERGKVFSYNVIDITGALTRFQFPINQEYYPNVYVSVTAYAPDRAVRFGSKNIIVDSDPKKLNLTILPDKQAYNPGDQVTLHLKSADTAGQPIVADVSLAIVDMSVLALRGNPEKDPLDFFYGHIPLTVETDSNYKDLLKEIDWKSDGGKGGSGGDANSQKSRGVFKEVAYWNPDIITDQSGNAVITFTLPDNLTTWRSEAIGITKDADLGVAYKEFTTSKALMIVPLKPRFVLPGDKFSLGATIFNHSQNDFNGVVALKAPSSIDASKTSVSRSLSLKAGASEDVYFDVAVPETTQAGNIDYTISANGSGLSDSVDSALMVNENDAYEVMATAGETDSSASEAVYIPNTIIPDVGGLSIRSSATLGVYLPQAIKYILDYPYDCTEQIGSQIQALALLDKARLIPNSGNSANQGKLVFDGKEQAVGDIIKSQLQSIYNRQNYDGGFKLWSDESSSDIFATREALKTFDTLDRAGYSIDQDVWDKGAAYLYDQYLHSNVVYTDQDTVDFAEALFTRPKYVAVGVFQRDFVSAASDLLKQEKIPTGQLVAIDELSHRYGLMALQTQKMDLMLENRLVVDSRGSFLDADSDGSNDITAISNTARYVNILSMDKQSDAELSNMMRWLSMSRYKDGSWGSTEDTLTVIRALTAYLDWQPETSATFTQVDSLNGKAIDQFSYTPSTILTVLSKDIPMDQVHFGGMNTVDFSKSTDSSSPTGKIYYDLGLKYYLPANMMGPRDEGFVIKHGFYALSDTKNSQPLEQAKVGDVVREHIEITVPVTRRDVTIEDFIPAGMEIVDTSLATEDKTLSQTEPEVVGSTLWPDHEEWKDDRAFLYNESLKPGTYTFDYMVRALVPGSYLELPAQISELYAPENFGRTGAGSFSISK